MFKNIKVSDHVILILSFEGEIDSILILFIVGDKKFAGIFSLKNSLQNALCYW